MVNGKNKGNSFERKISNLFSERFESYTGIPKSFRRNSDSGSFFGGKNKKRTESYDLEKATFGDIITPTNFLFTIECKFYKEVPSFGMLVKKNITKWDTWINQAANDANAANKKFMLIIKYNSINEIVLLEEKVMDEIFTYKVNDKIYYVYNLSDILSLNDNFFFEG